MASAGIRQIKNQLSRYIRRVEAGERVAAGTIRPPLESGDPAEDWPDIRLPAGTAAALIDADRGET